MFVLPMVLLFSVLLACATNTPFTGEPQPGMGVRFTQRGLEKFCQKGYSIVPNIISAMNPFQIPPVTLGPLTLTLSNVRPRTVRVSSMRVFLLDKNYVKMEVRDGLMQVSMRIDADLMGGTGSVDCLLSLKGFGGDISLQIGDDKSCPYHFGMFDIKSAPQTSGLSIDAVGLDPIGSILANTLQGMEPTLDAMMRNTVLQSLMNTIFSSIKEAMLNLPLITNDGNYLTDQRYINGINVVDKKIVADQGGFSMITPQSGKIFYPKETSLSVPKAVYTDRDYELYFDRESINSYLYVWHVANDEFGADRLTIEYPTVKSQNIPGLAKALVDAGMLRNIEDPGADVTLSLSVQPSGEAPHVPWIGAAALPINFTGSFAVSAAAKSSSATATLVNIEGSATFSSTLNLRKYTYGFANDQARAYLVLGDLHNIIITKKLDGAMADPEPLLECLVTKLYAPFLNGILDSPGIVLMNGNFIDVATATSIHLCGEDKVLLVADIEKNRYFA